MVRPSASRDSLSRRIDHTSTPAASFLGRTDETRKRMIGSCRSKHAKCRPPALTTLSRKVGTSEPVPSSTAPSSSCIASQDNPALQFARTRRSASSPQNSSCELRDGTASQGHADFPSSGRLGDMREGAYRTMHRDMADKQAQRLEVGGGVWHCRPCSLNGLDE